MKKLNIEERKDNYRKYRRYRARWFGNPTKATKAKRPFIIVVND